MKASRLILCGLILLLLCALAACSSKESLASGDGQELIPVQLSFAMSGSEVATKANVNQLTELANSGSFRGMENIRVVAFSSSGAVTGSSQALSDARPMPSISNSLDDRAFTGAEYHKGLIRNNHAHLYPDAYAALPKGTRTVLVYGKAPHIVSSDVLTDKHLNGSLIESGWETDGSYITASNLTFSPEPISTADTEETTNRIATILNDIVTAVSYTQTYYYQIAGTWYTATTSVSWNENVGDATLREYFRWITGDSQLMTGAGGNLEYMLTSLYRRLLDFKSLEEDVFKHTVNGIQYTAVLTNGGDDTFTYKYLYEKLRDVIISRFNSLVDSGDIRIDSEKSVFFYDDDLRYYPRSMGIPAGAAVLRWKGLNFAPATGGLDGIAPIDRFCFMPSLYYFANTTLSTSDDRNIYNQYTKDKTSWSSILDQYRLGKVVDKSTHSVALDQPLQYSNGLLVATVRAAASTLPDNDDDSRTHCRATGTNFPVTGIIISSQFRQNFDFTPDTDADEYNLYDRNITGVYLTTTESAEIRTMVLPTPANRDVYFYLELRNDSGESFTGAEGVIVPGQYFYLSGKLDKSDNPSYPRVFMQDHMTTAHCTVSSMENAHICVPEMGNPQLMLGIQTSVNWKMGASSYVILD